jgi:hypothetical protein
MSKLVKTLFNSSRDFPDKKEALAWSKLYEKNLLNALQECPRGDWLIWMMSRSNIDPRLLLEIAYKCTQISIILELEAWGDMPFRRGLHITEEWLSGKALDEDCQDGLDELDFSMEREELDMDDPIHLAGEIVRYLLTACIDISQQSPKSDIAYDLSWGIYTAAKLQSRGKMESFNQVLTEYVNFIHKSLKSKNFKY